MLFLQTTTVKTAASVARRRCLVAQKKYEPIRAGATLLLLCIGLVALGATGVAQKLWPLPYVNHACIGVGAVMALALLLRGVVQRNIIGYELILWLDNPGNKVRLMHTRTELCWFGKGYDLVVEAFGCALLRMPIGGIFKGHQTFTKGSVDLGEALGHNYEFDPTDDRRVRVRAGSENSRVYFEDYVRLLERLNLIDGPRKITLGELLDKQTRFVDVLIDELSRRRDESRRRAELEAERLMLLGEITELRKELEAERSNPPQQELEETPPEPRVYSAEDVGMLAPTSKVAQTAEAVGEVIVSGTSLVAGGAKMVAGEAARIAKETAATIKGLPGIVEELTLEDLTDAKNKINDGK